MKRRNFFKMLGGVISGLVVVKYLPAEEKPFIEVDKASDKDVSECYYYAINQNGEKGWWTAKELTDDTNVMSKTLHNEAAKRMAEHAEKLLFEG